ncbi:MAG: deoxyribonuclease V [Gammaproteobacteria bacterium]|nr:deoxyribonuclease V [Gammaproteobacteria bacterium]NIM74623.1 deoxyribonuclease V [Gammaproteobacteria bacterium]NIO26456.1 deoxyribonuclease V [Gammaproteobacteria bacterium]NIO67008.1 deoxyribonuclease V [Gammaproteobacteria bacterium]NIP46794.1 deoxyribonuclease V [Gammaproteobacteria bacterium]
MLKLHHQHAWEVSPREARGIQEHLRRMVETSDRLGAIDTVAGVDVGFDKNKGLTRAAVALLTFPGLEPVEQAVVTEPTRFPYVPGLLSFREAPAILAALERLAQLPDVLLCDGQGVAHPRRFGIACHLGVLTDLPSIGVAKKRLVGSHDEPGARRGDWAPLIHEDEVIGAVLRSRAGVKPIYVSCGHRVSLATAVDLVMRCTTRFRLPETTRRADRLASAKA